MSDSALAPLTDRVDSAILGNPHLKGCSLQVELRGSRIVLRGTVGSYYQKQIAQEVARVVEGVEKIDNQLVVNWAASVDRF
jgi:osmotically-inducible protein OsmY